MRSGLRKEPTAVARCTCRSDANSHMSGIGADSESGDICNQSQFQSQLEDRGRRDRLSAGCGY